ncbi:MAG: hypothetical protein JO224_01660 [Pelomonas sp.]|nr:hypothetical protein [Roseateles sp.]
MKNQTHSASGTRRLPPPEWNGDKGRKHEAFNAAVGSDRRTMARAMRLDRKR